MRKRFIFHFNAACFIALLFVFIGCTEKDYYVNPNDSKEPSTSAYATDRAVELQLNYQMPVGYVSTFDLYTENPLNEDGSLNTELTPISGGGGINISGVSKLVKTLPTHVSELYAYSSDLFAPTLMRATIENGVASFTQVALGPDAPELPQTRTVGNGKVDKYLKIKSDFYKSNKYSGKTLVESKYDLKVPDKIGNIPGDYLTAIGQTFPEQKKVDPKYYRDVTMEIQQANENHIGAQIFVSVIRAGGSYNNSLSYFVYNGSKELKDLTLAERNKLEIISVFQYADVVGNTYKDKGQGLIPGHYVQLKYKNDKGEYVKEFPVGSKIGWVLHSNGFNSDFTVNSGADRIYSIADWNSNKLNKTIYFTAGDEKNPFICFGFEDQLNGGDNDCNDVIFHIETDPITAIEKPPFIPEKGTIEKDVTHKGILAFEDNWPAKGDYDLNDVMVKYNSTVTYVQDGETTEDSNGELVGKGDITVKRVEDVFTIYNNGADFDNGFSYKVHVPLSKVKDITVTDNEGQTAPYTALTDTEGFVIDLMPNIQDINLPAVYTVKMTFNDKVVLDSDFESLKAPYNPFIIPTNTTLKVNGIEVHLPYKEPTTRMNRSLFGTHLDVSKPEKGIYYAAEKGTYYPFALHLAGVDDFEPATETRPIDESYPRYMDWVNGSCGAIAADWYLTKKP